jgi:DNA-binding winged helix-turn-helix (wHTH) protein/predicted ATPase
MGPGADRVIRFGSYVLHPTQGLRCNARELRVTQKALRVLYLLAGRQGQVVTKEEIFDAVWPGVAVSDAALTSCIKELRRALKDDARSPRFIETRHRLGFRFLEPTDATPMTPVAPLPTEDAHRTCVGRAEALRLLAASLDHALAGSRRLAVVHGEAGIGKTTLVDTFVRSVRDGTVLTATAACVEAYGAVEPYGPLLDALRSLCGRSGDRDRVMQLRQHAPTWWAQFPSFHGPADGPAVDRWTAGVTRERMSRELSDYLDAVAGDQPLILWIDDVHWADDRTLDWLAAFAARPEPSKVLLIVTLRDGYHAHADRLFAGLAMKPWCAPLTLAGLDEAATRLLVERRQVVAGSGAANLAARLHELTEGHPLFIGAFLDALSANPSAFDWTTASATPGVGAPLTVPDRLCALIEEQIGRLGAHETQLLEVASLTAVPEWPSALITAGLADMADDAETLLMRLSSQGAFIQHTGSVSWPDGTIAARFAFRHAIHRAVFARRVTGRRHADIHHRIGMRLEQAFKRPPPELLLALALHFEQAGDFERTTRYLTEAARSANRMGAGEEAIRHLTRALALLRGGAPSTRRDEREVELQMLLGGACMAVHGWGAPEVERAYQRAQALCDGLESTAHHFPTYWGLWLFRWGRGELSLASDLLTVLQRRYDAAPDPMRLLQVFHAQWATAYCMGKFDVTVDCAARGWTLSRGDVPGEATLSYGNHHAGVCARAFAARALASQGRCDEARAAADDAVREARRFAHPFSLALTLVFAAATHQLLREPDDVVTLAEEAEAISSAHGFRLLLAWASALRGWSLSLSDRPAAAVEIVRDAVSAALRTGSGQFRTLFLCLLAEAQLAAGDPAAGLAAIQDAFGVLQSTGERFHEAELHRLQGQLLAAHAPEESVPVVAAFDRGVTAARQQGAHLLGLRNLIALVRYQRERGDVTTSRELRAAMPFVVGLPPADREAAGEALAMWDHSDQALE